MTDVSRRDFLAAGLAAAPLLPLVEGGQPSARRATRIRTVTAGVTVKELDDRAPAQAALAFLARARRTFEEAGYEVQTLRATVALPVPPPTPSGSRQADALAASVQALDGMAASHGALLSIGAVNRAVTPDLLPNWIAELLKITKCVSCSVDVADRERGLREADVRLAADAISRIAGTSPQGLGNFRFAAAANIADGTPFFPVSRHAGDASFALGLESAGVVADVLREAHDPAEARDRLTAALNEELSYAERLAAGIASREARRYLGIDASPAPGMDRSIGRAIESFTHVPFGRASTLSACALITDALKRVSVKTCGYSGLMLPVLEDPVLAARASDRTYGVQELLLFSSVCGTGLDVVPLAGDTPVERIVRLVHDVAALAVKWQKPLSARLLPVPGVPAGGRVHFDDPLLTDCVAMQLE